MTSIVRATGLGVERAAVRILHDIDLDVLAGETVGISGPNGSGKTTLVRTIATLTNHSSGSLELFGQPGSRAARRQIGFIGHRPNLIEQLTLEENLAHVARLSGFAEDRVQKAIDVVGLSGARARRASDSSFGMQRRIEIAYQMISRPRLLLLDEAGSGLDSSAVDLIMSIIDLTTGAGGAAVVVSHDQSHLARTTTRQLHLVNGTLEIPS